MVHKGYFSPIIVVLILLGCVFISGCTDQNNETGFYTYENAQRGIIIEYPVTWTKYENPPQIPDVLVLFTSQSEEPTKIGSLMVSVLDLEDYMDMDWFKDAHIENLSKDFTDLNIIFNDSSTLADLQAYKLIFTFTQDVYTWRQLEIWTIKDNTLYLLVHQADQANHNEFTDIIEQMIDSFEIL